MKNTKPLGRPCVILKADGSFEHRPPANGRDYTLGELQKIVGGYVEIIKTPRGMFMVIDEEGKLNEKPVNIAATEIFRGLGVDDVVVGDVLYCDPSMVK